jgi:hypothetical protein
MLMRRKFPEIENDIGTMRSVLFAILVLVSVAGEASYVYCDNGLRCVMAPCPSNNALDLSTGAVMRGVSIDTEKLPAKNRTADLPNDLHAGKLVLRGFIEERTVNHTGKAYRLPYLVATAVERAATSSETARCKAR